MPKRIIISPDLQYQDSISPLIYGEFIELLNDLIPGMWSEKVQDRCFEGVRQPEQVYPPGQNWVFPRWHTLVAARTQFDHWPAQPAELEMGLAQTLLDLDGDQPFVGHKSARVTVRANASARFIAGIAQDHIALKQGQPLNLELYARGDAFSQPLSVLLGRNYGVFFRVYDRVDFPGLGEKWQRLADTLTSSVTDDDATLLIGTTRPGTFCLDKVSLMPQDNCSGWRRDVVDAVRTMKPGIIRFGGSSLIYYDWRSGVGPREQRAPFENRPWGNMEENDVGLHEFLQFCEWVAATPLICLNSNSTTVTEILEEIEYCNGPVDSHWGSVRAAAGHPEPFGVRYWQIGNEQNGAEYERRMVDYAEAIRQRHPELILLASYPSENILLNLSDEIDYVCPHIYMPYSQAVEHEISSLIGVIQNRARNKAIKIAVTEWNHTGGHWGWARAWLLTMFNALNAARMFNLYQRHGDMIRIANRSNMTNSCNSGTIQTSRTGMYLTPTYYVQRAYSNLAGDQALRIDQAEDEVLDIAATRRQVDGEVAMFVVNYTGETQKRELRIGLSASRHCRGWTLSGPGLDAVNSFIEPDCIAPREWEMSLSSDTVELEFPAYSLTVLRV